MKRLALVVVMAACGHAAPAASPTAPAKAQRPCVHGAEPVPASCIRASARGKLLKDDHDQGMRIWQACERGSIVDGSYVGERVGNGRNTSDQNLALLQAHAKAVLGTGATGAGMGACGGDDGDHDEGCIEVEYEPADEDVPSVMGDLLRAFASPDDLCLPFRIDTGTGPKAQLL